MKELEDYDWFPKLLRQYQTDYIGFIVARFNIYAPFISYLQAQKELPSRMFDLCSGSGEPAITIFKQSKQFESLTLSDKYPDTSQTFEDNISYISLSTDVLKQSFQSHNTYTMFNAFHHFSDADKLKIITEMSKTRAKGYFVEILSPDFIHILKILFATTLGTLLLTPFIKPFSLKRLFLTYIIPINVLTILFDGIISVIKSNSVKEYKSLLQPLDEHIEVFKIKSGLNALIVIKVN